MAVVPDDDTRLGEEDIRFVKQLREALGGRVSRRAALTALLGGGAYAAGLSAGTAKAGTNQVGSIGTDADRVDIEAEDIDLTDQGSTPTTPESGQVRFYAKNGELFFLDDTGTENPVDGSLIGSGDGTQRDIYVIANGASDPAGAGTDDLIFEEEA